MQTIAAFTGFEMFLSPVRLHTGHQNTNAKPGEEAAHLKHLNSCGALEPT
jgi:hypothetical protein